jgi:hypothetical protein
LDEITAIHLSIVLHKMGKTQQELTHFHRLYQYANFRLAVSLHAQRHILQSHQCRDLAGKDNNLPHHNKYAV